MKSLLLLLVCVLIHSNTLMAQNISHLNTEEFRPQRQSTVSLRAQAYQGIKSPQHVKNAHRNPLTIQERLIGQSISNNNVKKDSFQLFYSNNRGSTTVISNDGNYNVEASADTIIYYGRNKGNFKLGWPNAGLTYNSLNNNIRLTTYYYDNTPYDNTIQTWDASDRFVEHRTFKRNYVLNSTDKTHDYYYRGTLYNKDGYGLRDTIVWDYSKNDKSLKSNFSWSSRLDLDEKGRYKFQRRQNQTISNLTIDTNRWEYNAPLDKLSAYIEMTTDTDLQKSITTTFKRTELWSYNAKNLVDTIKILHNDVPAKLEVFEYNTFDLITKVEYFDYVSEKLQPTAKILNDYKEDYQKAYTYYEWDTKNEQFVEIDKTEVTYDQNDNWDTVRVYKNQLLSYMLVHTFTKMNNIKTITKFEKNKVTEFVLFTYEEYQTSGTSEIANNLEVNVYPNPLTNVLHIVFKDNLNEDFNIDIMNMTGTVITHFSTNQVENNLPLDQLPQGMYLIQISNKDKSINKIQKIIKI